MKAYELVLKNSKKNTYQKISWLIVAMNFFAFLYIAYQLINTNKYHWPLLGAILIASYAIIFGVLKRKEVSKQPQFSIPFIIAAFTWVLLHNFWFVLFIFLIVVFENISKQKLVVCVDREKITFPSFPKKELKWSSIKNLILKDDILTIDLHNNKLFQALVIEKNVNENQFNEFCREQITRK
ncbi:MAG: hypothetical protein H0V30_15700 [Chitinophagaceae bacterium]|jgi:hypothetical protein|nr:hypothetical protein [Chitinophagaceae bacterium]